MAYLFIVENNVAKPTDEVLLIEPYKSIWERDKSKNKIKALNEFTFIEFMVSKKKSNPYKGYDEESRFEKLCELYLGGKKPDNLIEQGMSDLDTFQKEASETYRYYESASKAAEKLQIFFNTFDITDVNEKGQLLYKPRDITSALNDTTKVLQNLNSLKEKVEQELFDITRTKSNKEINYFEV